ncbi:hypothetical protein ERO13_D13G073300v2 [Gossypium hirsutum]|uniref:Uncharacterized protein n=6 Tax=Gossypium TaxID=3633 RepID=A0A0D2VB03_GOSRA|nr:uncharacterized protein LOC105783285 [Gossypium raimondii]XP_016705568.1 uncharacterized protein LOC107920382 [Gossypium hirsutum]KAB1994178.1 hypothetical protein ES319_D13G081700v1 [Gossypium barbadense]MBA0843282.1 hypothetical protein [Gossypium armourianum]TYG36738.1 hypothetical protein ES288_D13G087100v1 [Gossypium darwinii]TYI46125.1 hypothetical protein E1A91_D13G084600v1 [Gossypium mustelinum]KAG4110870.1 hypothetical protein ERO13_D13G073300v2 [Gossypium hirsutum]
MAAEPTPKRQREETQSSNEEHVEETKRHKSYNHILSLLEAEEDEPSQDLSPLITTLQQQLSSDSVLDAPFPLCQPATPSPSKPDKENATAALSLEDCTSATCSLKEDDDDKEQVIRHLLEASDDELGIPNREDGDGDGSGGGGDVGFEVFELEQGFNNGGNGFALCDGLWELEDEAANYYTLLQSELFM